MSDAPLRDPSPLRLPPPAPHSPFVYGLSKVLVWCWSKVWFRFTVRGAGNVPRKGPVLLVANHTSYLDPPLLGTATPRYVHFLAQSGLSKVGPLHWWLRKVGVSLIDRRAPSKDVLRHLSEALEQGSCIGLFAEGTRSEDGSVGSFRSGVEFLVRRTKATVVPVGIEGAFRAYPRGGRFPRPVRCTVRFGAPMTPDAVLAPGGVERLRRDVAQLANAPLAADRGSADCSKAGQGSDRGPADVASSPGRTGASSTSP